MFDLKDLQRACELVYTYMQPTPQYNWPQLSSLAGCNVWVKHENHTPTTAFKVRGGLNLLHQLKHHQGTPAGVLSATRGNHGQSLAYAGSKTGIPVTIVVPECNNPDQNAAIESFGAELVIHGEDFEAARLHSLALQEKYGYQIIAPFEQALVVGVATYAFELFQAVQDLDTVYVPIGMGSGICSLIKTRDLLGLKTDIVGVVSEGAPAFSQSFTAGKILPTDKAETFADGVATRAPMEEAFEVILNGAARVITVSDEQIAEAMFHYYKTTHNLAEGAGAVSLAGLLSEQTRMRGKNAGVVLSGGNIDLTTFYQRVAPFVN